VLIYADGGGGTPGISGDMRRKIAALVKKRVGWAVRISASKCPPAIPARPCRIGLAVYYEHQFSVNPMWKPEFKTFPNHPVARGVKPFALLDEMVFQTCAGGPTARMSMPR